jgi:hypothetical protein
MSFGNLERLVCHGDIEGTRNYLTSLEETTILWDWEPYTNIQKTRQVKAMQLVLNDPRLVFDHIFIGRMLYFSTRQLQDLVGNHPRTRDLLSKMSFMEAYDKDYPVKTWKIDAGIGQRYLHGDRNLRYVQKKQHRRVIFYLKPALRRYIRRWLDLRSKPV